MGKKLRPKSKQEKLQERRKNFLDEEEVEDLFLDEGASAEERDESDDFLEQISFKKPRLNDDVELNESDDDMPEEISFKKPKIDEDKPGNSHPEHKKKRKRRIRKREPGIYSVETKSVFFLFSMIEHVFSDLQLKVVAEKSVVPAQMLHPKIHFKEMLLQEATKSGRKKVVASSNKVSQKWLKQSKKKL